MVRRDMMRLTPLTPLHSTQRPQPDTARGVSAVAAGRESTSPELQRLNPQMSLNPERQT